MIEKSIITMQKYSFASIGENGLLLRRDGSPCYPFLWWLAKLGQPQGIAPTSQRCHHTTSIRSILIVLYRYHTSNICYSKKQNHNIFIELSFKFEALKIHK